MLDGKRIEEAERKISKVKEKLKRVSLVSIMNLC